MQNYINPKMLFLFTHQVIKKTKRNRSAYPTRQPDPEPHTLTMATAQTYHPICSPFPAVSLNHHRCKVQSRICKTVTFTALNRLSPAQSISTIPHSTKEPTLVTGHCSCPSNGAWLSAMVSNALNRPSHQRPSSIQPLL